MITKPQVTKVTFFTCCTCSTVLSSSLSQLSYPIKLGLGLEGSSQRHFPRQDHWYKPTHKKNLLVQILHTRLIVLCWNFDSLLTAYFIVTTRIDHFPKLTRFDTYRSSPTMKQFVTKLNWVTVQRSSTSRNEIYSWHNPNRVPVHQSFSSRNNNNSPRSRFKCHNFSKPQVDQIEKEKPKRG
jgi:hypothetical protein